MKDQSTVRQPFVNRNAAGRQLAEALWEYRNHPDAIVLALPRGGVPVAYQVASRLGLPLDLMVVRKLGMPGYEELAMGAIAGDGVRVMNENVVTRYRISTDAIENVAQREHQELLRRGHVYRGERPWPALQGRAVILVDDGVATGATMLAAVAAARAQHAARVVVATPVVSPDVLPRLEKAADEVCVLVSTSSFYAVGTFYHDFSPIEDDEVLEILQQAWQLQADDATATRTVPASRRQE